MQACGLRRRRQIHSGRQPPHWAAKPPEMTLAVDSLSGYGGLEVNEDQQERLARNELLFRTLNENISSVAAGLAGDEPFEFVCECSTIGCVERLPLTLVEYEQIRQDGTHFLLADGHEDIEIEQVVSRRPGYVVVEKDGVAGLVAEADDPRG